MSQPEQPWTCDCGETTNANVCPRCMTSRRQGLPGTPNDPGSTDRVRAGPYGCRTLPRGVAIIIVIVIVLTLLSLVVPIAPLGW